MAYSILQTKEYASAGYVTEDDIALDSPVTAGSLILVLVRSSGSVTVTDNNGNSYAQIGSGAEANYGGHGSAFYAYNANAGATSINVDGGAAYSDFSIIIREYGNIEDTEDPLGPFLETDETSYFSTHSIGPTSVPSFANGLVVMGVTGDSTAAAPFSGGSGIGNVAESVGNDVYSCAALGDKVMSSAAAQSGSITDDGEYTNGYVFIAIFKEKSMALATASHTLNGLVREA